jgi:hypothetical protein
LVAVGVIAGCGGGNKGTADPFAKEISPNSTVKPAAGVDPDELPEAGSDTNTVVRRLRNNHYELTVTNTSDIGFINSFTWLPPSQVTITAVTDSSSGNCQLSSNNITCDRLTIRPPKCTCEPGGTVTVHFVATTAQASLKHEHGEAGALVGSSLRLGVMTVVPYVIPSYPGAEPMLDLPLCTKRQQSTEANPCIHAG